MGIEVSYQDERRYASCLIYFMYSPLCRMEETVLLIVDVGIRKMMETRTCQQILVESHVENAGIIMRGSRPTRLSFGQGGVR